MSTLNFDQLFKNLSTEVESLASNSLKDFENEAKSDGQKALDNIKLNLQQWSDELLTGAITPEDLRYLLKEEEGLNSMVALKQAGLAAIHIDEFRNNLVNTIVSTITGLVKI